MNVPWVTLFKYCSRNFDPSLNMALVNGGFLHFTDMRKFLKNRWSDLEIILQESGFDISGRPDCPIRTVIAPFGQAAFSICEPAGQVKFLVHYHRFGSLSQIPVSLRSISKWILNCLQNSLKK